MINHDDFQFSIPLQVRINDINYGNHVGNQVFVEYFHEVRVQYLNNLGYSEQDLGSGAGLILAEIHCELKGEAFYCDQLTIYTRICDIKRTSFRMDYLILREDPQKLIAKGYTIQAAFDYPNRKMVSLDKELVRKITAFEKIN